MLILVVGAILRPKKAELVAVLPGNELATLPERSQRRELRDIADYVGQRAASLAAFVMYLPALGASGVVVGRDSVLSAAVRPRAPEVLLVQRIEGDSGKPAPRMAGMEDAAPRWAVAVARAPDGRLLSLAGLTGSAVPIRCGELALRELTFGAQLPEAFAGGGLFDLDGKLLALAMPCVDHIVLVPLRDVVEALERQGTLESRLWAHLGFRVATTDSLRPAVPGANAGLTVVETLVGGPADQAGLRPGDVIGRTGSGPVTALSDLQSLVDSSGTGRLELRRGRVSVTLRVIPDSGKRPPSGIVTGGPSQPLVLRAVGAGSRAERAGLREGDRILQIGRNQRPTAAAVARALNDSGALFVVFEREGRRRGIVLP